MSGCRCPVDQRVPDGYVECDPREGVLRVRVEPSGERWVFGCGPIQGGHSAAAFLPTADQRDEWIETQIVTGRMWTNVTFPGYRIVKTDTSDYFTVQNEGRTVGEFRSEKAAKKSSWFKR